MSYSSIGKNKWELLKVLCLFIDGRDFCFLGLLGEVLRRSSLSWIIIYIVALSRMSEENSMIEKG